MLFVTQDEGTSSYAARLFRILRKPAILDGKFTINKADNSIKFGDKVFKAGDTVSVCAT